MKPVRTREERGSALATCVGSKSAPRSAPHPLGPRSNGSRPRPCAARGSWAAGAGGAAAVPLCLGGCQAAPVPPACSCAPGGCPSSPGCSSLAPGELGAGMGATFSCKPGVPGPRHSGRRGLCVPRSQRRCGCTSGQRVCSGGRRGGEGCAAWPQSLGVLFSLLPGTGSDTGASRPAGMVQTDPAAEPLCSQVFLFPPAKHLRGGLASRPAPTRKAVPVLESPAGLWGVPEGACGQGRGPLGSSPPTLPWLPGSSRAGAAGGRSSQRFPSVGHHRVAFAPEHVS